MTQEDQHTEWKASWRDDLLKRICGFANADGGVLVIGRNDQGVPVGLKDAAKLLEDIPNKVRDALGIMVDVNLLTEQGRDLLEIRVEPYPSPISHKGAYCYRSGSTLQELKGPALERFLLKKRGLHWDSVPEPKLHIDACSPAAFKLFTQKASRSGRMDEAVLQDSPEAILDNLELLEGHMPRRAATLLFTDKPERFVSGAWIKIGFFVTNDDLRYQDEVHGNLFEQVDKTLETIKQKYLKAYISYDGLQRVETFLFPMAALREALLNAIVHKDYSSSIPIQISVYEDQIVMWNAGQLPTGWTLDRLLGKHPSRPFNPLVASAFFRSGFIESWGRGIEKIDDACRAHGIEPPEYDASLSGLMLTFRANPAHLAAQGRATQETTQETTQEKILALLKAQPSITGRELAQHTGLSADGVKYHLGKLRTAGIIRHVGPTKSGHWEVLK